MTASALTVSLILLGAVLLVIAAVLGHRRERKRQVEVKWNGSAFEVELVAPRVEQVRSDYVAAAHCPSHRSSCRAHWIKTARCVLARLGYFQSRREEAQQTPNFIT
ncbi:MAG: hypothetical protein L0Z50_36435 [Verrucomicrobiales bacterium]|nr:hypothetical protein [Verrucomicrobiales bacterium]